MLGIVAVGASQTAVLYYFGWARTNAFLEYFGLDPTVVGYDTTDYVLRSIGVAFPAAVGVSVVGLAALVVHRGVVAPLAGRRAARHPVGAPVLPGGAGRGGRAARRARDGDAGAAAVRARARVCSFRW